MEKDKYPEFTKNELGEFLDRGERYIPVALAFVAAIGFFIGLGIGILIGIHLR